VAPGWDLIVNARHGAERADYWSLRDALSGLMVRAGLLDPGEAPSR
jgi:RNase P protein component